MNRFALSILPVLLAGSGTAFAQDREADLDDSVFDETHLTLGGGVSYGPSYDGSDDYVASVLPIVSGSIEGFEIQPRGPGGAIDLIRDGNADRPVEFILGPVATLNFDRTRDIEDNVVASLGELDTAIELGGTAGVKFNDLLNEFDSVTAVVDVKWDVASAHGGMSVAPTLAYFTPVSRGAAVSLSLNAEYIDDDYADYYYSITPAGNVASGLPVFQAEGGWKSAGATALFFVDLDGNLLNGGFSLIALGSYNRMLEDAKDSPITSIRGDADQWLGAVGVAYTF